MSGVDSELIRQGEYLLVHRVVEQLCTALLEVCASTTSNEQRVTRVYEPVRVHLHSVVYYRTVLLFEGDVK